MFKKCQKKCFELETQNTFHSYIRILKLLFIREFRMTDLATLLLLNELIDPMMKSPGEKDFFNNIIKDWRVEERFGFK